jgi:sulfur-oxidizing protein SoxX
MPNTASIFKTAFALVALLGTLLLGSIAPANAEEAKTTAQKGKEVAVDRKKGNCLACHAMDDGSLPGNIGPPLVAMKLRFPDKAVLRAQIWDATVKNPNTIMPPFGRHQMLSEEEIDWITEYVHGL